MSCYHGTSPFMVSYMNDPIMGSQPFFPTQVLQSQRLVTWQMGFGLVWGTCLKPLSILTNSVI